MKTAETMTAHDTTHDNNCTTCYDQTSDRYGCLTCDVWFEEFGQYAASAGFIKTDKPSSPECELELRTPADNEAAAASIAKAKAEWEALTPQEQKACTDKMEADMLAAMGELPPATTQEN